MTEHVSLKVRPLHKGYFALRNKSEADVLTVNRNSLRPSGTSDRPSGLDLTPRRPTGRVPLASGPPPEIPLLAPELRQWRGARRSTAWQGLVREILHPQKKSQAGSGKISPIKRWGSRPNRDLSFISQK